MRRTPLVLAGTALGVVAAAAILHRTRGGMAVESPEGILLADVGLYDRVAGRLLGSFYAGIARDVASVSRTDAHVLDIGCGPGHLAADLVARKLHVTAIDLDPRMVEQARLRLGPDADVRVADVAALPFEDASFDLVVSTLSMHHWADKAAGLAEVARVLRPHGTALIYDLGGVFVPLHGGGYRPVEHVEGSALTIVDARPWRWPGPITLAHRIEARPA